MYRDVSSRPLSTNAIGHAELRRGVAVILLASFLIGAMAVFVRLAAREMGSGQIAFVRFSGALLFLLGISRGRNLRPRAGNVRYLVLRGILGAASISLYFRAIQYAGAGFATMIHCTYPVHAAYFAAFFLGERLHRRLALALVLNITGAAVMLLPGFGLSDSAATGGLLALAAAVLAGGAVTTARGLRGSESAMLITTAFMVVGTLFTSPALLGDFPPMTATLGFALLGVVLSSAGGQFFLHQGLGHTSASTGSLVAACAVFTAAGLESLFLGETMTIRTMAGGVLMIAAVATVSTGGSVVTHAIDRGVPAESLKEPLIRSGKSGPDSGS